MASGGMASDISPLRFARLAVGHFPGDGSRAIQVWGYQTERVWDEASAAFVVAEYGELIGALADARTFAHTGFTPRPSRRADFDHTTFHRTTGAAIEAEIRRFLGSGARPHTLDEIGLATELPLPIPDSWTPYRLADRAEFLLVDRSIGQVKEIVLVSPVPVSRGRAPG